MLGGSGEVSNVDAIFAVHALNDQQQNNQQGNQQQQDDSQEALEPHAIELLDSMKTLQLQILNGEVDVDQLEALQAKLVNDLKNTNHPMLIKIIKDIELRAAVELAKLQRGLNLERE